MKRSPQDIHADLQIRCQNARVAVDAAARRIRLRDASARLGSQPSVRDTLAAAAATRRYAGTVSRLRRWAYSVAPHVEWSAEMSDEELVAASYGELMRMAGIARI